MGFRKIYCSHGYEHVIETCDICGEDVPSLYVRRLTCMIGDSAIRGAGSVLCPGCFAEHFGELFKRHPELFPELVTAAKPPSSE